MEAQQYAEQRAISDSRLLPESLQQLPSKRITHQFTRTKNRELLGDPTTMNTIKQKPSKSANGKTEVSSAEWKNIIHEIGDLSEERDARLMVPRGTFSTHTVHKGGRKQKSRKRSHTSKHKMRSIQFIVPSRKKIQKRNMEENQIKKAVKKMSKKTLETVLKQNKIIKHDSKAPVSLMQNIANGVFSL
jgi:hypothetical protein